MTVPANLFIDSPEVEDASLTALSKTTDEWPEELVQRVKERIPASAGMAIMVKFMKKDDEMGAAVGSVIVSSADKSAVVPVVIKDFYLSPMDVMLTSGKVLPLTPDYFNAAMQRDGAFDRLDDFPIFSGLGRFEQNSLWSAAYPPSTGRYAYASGGYPILEDIASTIDGAEFKAFLLKQANEAVTAQLLTGPHKELVRKLAELRPTISTGALTKQAVANVMRPIMVMKKEASNRYTVFANSDKTFNPSVVTCDRASAAEFVSAFTSKPDAFIDGLETMGERILFAPKDHGGHVLAKPEKEEPVSCDAGCYSVRTPNNISLVGHVFPKVVDFDMKPQDMKVFVGKGKGAIQKDIWGTKAVSKEELHYESPATGATGVFVYSAHGEEPVCTAPVKISMIVADPRVLTLRVEDLMGRPITLKVSKGKDSLHRIAKLGDGEYLLPGSRVRWVPTGDLIQVTGSKEDYMTKVAGERITTDPITVIPTGYSQYSIKGLDKYAAAMGWDKTNVGRAETMFLLASVGCSGSTINEALEKTSSSRIHSYTTRPHLAAEKIAMARPLANILVKKAKDIKANLVKEAAYMESAQTVDALLSLNFVTPDNLSKFVSKIPAFKAVVSHLASCLLAARIGVKEIPEQAASTAMHRLLDVISGLESIKASQALGAGQ